MKFKFTLFLAAGGIIVTTAYAQAQQTVWIWMESNSRLQATGPEANARLNKNIAACTAAVKQVANPDPNDFESCMSAAGWEKQAPAQPAKITLPKITMTADDEKAVHASTIKMRQKDLVREGGQYSIGVQGYLDRYQEPNLGVHVKTRYYGATAAYTRREENHNFWMLDGRIARGFESYNSPSGHLDGVPENEGEIRLTDGHDYDVGNNWLSAYLGLGARIFRGYGKGYVTDLGKLGYDRRIEQLYAPVGVTWHSLLSERVTMADTLEVDPLLIGRVDSRLQNVGGPNLVNTQSIGSGFGIRGEAMFGMLTQDTLIEMGPFFRYWNINDSQIKITNFCNGGACVGGMEPYNKRIQIGMNARVSF